MTRFSDRNFGSRAAVQPSTLIVCAREPLWGMKVSLAGSSFVAMSVPGQLADNPRSRLLMQGTAQTTVSPNKFSRAKTAAAREDKEVGRVGMFSSSAGPFSFFQISQSL